MRIDRLTDVGQKKKRKYEHEEPVSLAPLSFEEALAALVRVKPEDAEKAPQSDKEPEGGREGQPEHEDGK